MKRNDTLLALAMMIGVIGLMCSCARSTGQGLSPSMADRASRAFILSSPIVRDATGPIQQVRQTSHREMVQPQPRFSFWVSSRGYSDISYQIEGVKGPAAVSVRSQYRASYWEVTNWSLDLTHYKLSDAEDQIAREVLRNDEGILEEFGTLHRIERVEFNALQEFPDPNGKRYEDKLLVTYKVAGSRRTGQVRVDLRRVLYGWSKIYCWILDDNQPFDEMLAVTAPAQ